MNERNWAKTIPTSVAPLFIALFSNILFANPLSFFSTGDAADLDLTFSVDDEVFGQHIVTPLKPGGQGISVTNENKILYVHLMADYKLNRWVKRKELVRVFFFFFVLMFFASDCTLFFKKRQLKQQTDAFIRGFRFFISTRWLRYFSATGVLWRNVLWNFSCVTSFAH